MEIVNRLIINYKCIKVKCTKFLVLPIKTFYMTFFLENLLSRQYVCNIFQTLLVVALAKAKPERLTLQNFETVPLITLTARKKIMKAHVFPSSTVQFKSMLFFFSLLLDINFCFELVKVRKNLQQNFEALSTFGRHAGPMIL